MEAKNIIDLSYVDSPWKLTEGNILQMEAREQIMGILERLLDTVDSFKKQMEEASKYFSQGLRRSHDTITLNGARGTGKTTFLALLLEYIAKEEKDIVPLPLLDPTMIESQEHVFISIISMIIQEVQRKNERMQSDLYCSNEKYQLWLEQRKRLARGLVLLKEGNSDLSATNWDDPNFMLLS